MIFLKNLENYGTKVNLYIVAVEIEPKGVVDRLKSIGDVRKPMEPVRQPCHKRRASS